MKILVANKIDLPNRVIETERGEQLAKEYGLAFFETSARTGQNINELFQQMAQSIMKEKPHMTATNQNVGSSGSTRASTQNNSVSSAPSQGAGAVQGSVALSAQGYDNGKGQASTTGGGCC